MTETSLERVAERLAHLEAENRRLARRIRWGGRIGLASALGALVALACGATQQANPEVKPGLIIVKDPGGSKSEVRIGADQAGAFLTIIDSSGIRRVSVSGGKLGSLVQRWDDQGNPLP